MAQSGITTSDIVRAFEAQNKVVDAGGIDADRTAYASSQPEISLFIGRHQKPDYRSRSGEHFRLADIAQIEESYQTPASNLMRINDQPAMALPSLPYLPKCSGHGKSREGSD